MDEPMETRCQRTAALLAAGLPGCGTRRVAESDLGFLCDLYASTRLQELSTTGWTEEARQCFLVQQFRFQHLYYQQHYRGAEFLVLLREEHPIGRLYWQSLPARATLIDISLMPACCGQGLGSTLLSALAKQADAEQQAIELHVEPDNPARRLYERLGFKTIASNGVHMKMLREPGAMQEENATHEHSEH